MWPECRGVRASKRFWAGAKALDQSSMTFDLA